MCYGIRWLPTWPTLEEETTRCWILRPAQHPGEQTDPATAEQEEELHPPPDPWERTQQATPARHSSSSWNQQTKPPTSNGRGIHPSSLQARSEMFLPAPLWLRVAAFRVCHNKLVYLIMKEAKEQTFYSLLLHLAAPEQGTYLSRVWEKYFSVFAMSVPEGTG